MASTLSVLQVIQLLPILLVANLLFILLARPILPGILPMFSFILELLAVAHDLDY
jgi:hypothetical protein